jgi:hypothetical protein
MAARVWDARGPLRVRRRGGQADDNFSRLYRPRNCESRDLLLSCALASCCPRSRSCARMRAFLLIGVVDECDGLRARLLQLHGHVRAAVASQAEAILLADMRQHFDVPALPSARWAQAPGAVATGTDPHHPADRLHSPLVPPAVDKREPHGRWLAKNWVAFFRIFLSSLSTRFSRRSRSFSRARSACGAATRSAGRNSDTHLPSVDRPLPKIRRHTPPRQPTGQRNPHRLLLELF